MQWKGTTAAHKKWNQRVRKYADDHGAEPYGDFFNYQIHHVAGASYKHNKVYIGNWFVLPVSFQYHDMSSNDALNVTHHRRHYEEAFGKQSAIWLEMVNVIRDQDGTLPFSDEVIEAVLDSKY